MKQEFSDKDFTIDLFPINRRKQFGFVLKHNWKRFLFLGFILLLFSIPLILSFVFKDLRAVKIANSGEENITSLLFINELFFALFIIPSFAIFFVGLSGIFRIFRNLAWSEGILYKQDYLIGIKQNGLFFFIESLMFSIGYYASYLLSFYINISFVRYIPLALFLLIVIPVLFIKLSMISIYKNSFAKFIVNSIKIYVKKPLHLWVSEIVILLIPIVLLIFPMLLIVKYIVLIIYIFLMLPIICFAYQLLCIHIFDELINKENHEEIYKKGLFK